MVGTYIFPAEHGLAALAVYVCDGVQPRQQHALLRLPASHVYTETPPTHNKRTSSKLRGVLDTFTSHMETL